MPIGSLLQLPFLVLQFVLKLLCYLFLPLLEQGLAERKDAWEFGDWEKLALR